MKSLSGKQLNITVPGTDKVAEVYVIAALDSPYGVIQDYISDHIIETGTFFEADEVKAIMSELKKDDLFVDVGANLGTFTAAARALGCTTISIEPQPILQKSLKNNAKGCEVHAVGAGTSKEMLNVWEAFMRHPKRGTIMANIGGNDLIGSGGRKPSDVKVPIKTLDEIVGKRNPKIMKIDVEGMEADVLTSGMKVLERCHPILYVEQNHSEEIAECWRLIRPLGYQITEVLGGMGSSVVVRYAVN
jgi:FkbM family methyltransferase